MERRLRYDDLVALGIVKNRSTLRNWTEDQNFPPGQLTGPNCRTWGEGEVQRWIDNRPVKAKAAPVIKKGRIGRPRKGD